MIDASFPIDVTPDTHALLATTQLSKASRQPLLGTDAEGRLVLSRGLHAFVHTEAAGYVAVAKPSADDGSVDVASVIAAPTSLRPTSGSPSTKWSIFSITVRRTQVRGSGWWETGTHG